MADKVPFDLTDQIDLNDVRLLKKIVEHGSFAAASAATGIAKSTISQRIAALERVSGTGLLRRTSRSISLTEAGELLLPHAQTLDVLAQQVEMSLLQWQQGLRGTLRVSCDAALCQAAMPTLLQRFLALHDDASLRIQVDAADRSANPINPGIDLVIRDHIRVFNDSSLLQRVVARVSWVTAAAPEWLRANNVPACPDDVPAAALLAYPTVADRAFTFGRDGEERGFKAPFRLYLDDPTTLRVLAVAGAGVVCLPDYLLRDALRTGLLIPLFSDWRPPRSTITILTPPKAQSSPLASAFSDFLAAELPRALTE